MKNQINLIKHAGNAFGLSTNRKQKQS